MSRQILNSMLKGVVMLSMLVAAWSVAANGDESAVILYKSSNDYADTKENVEMAITDRGMLISGTLHVSDMLNRTGPDLGYNKNIYKKAESIEFCSAVLSHRMIMSDYRNLVICPFTIAIFVKAEEPEQVYVAFRRHYLAGHSDEEAKAIFELLDGIAREAIE